MPRHGELTNQEKTVSVLTHRGGPKSTLGVLTDVEEARLVTIYDETIGKMANLNGLFDKFWADHHKRLDADKAAGDETIRNIEKQAKTTAKDKTK